MADLRAAAGEVVKEAFCAITNAVEDTLALGDNLYDSVGLPGNPATPGPAAQELRNQRNLFCNEPPDDVAPFVQPPFSGGQCTFSYTINYSYEITNSSGGTDTGSGVTQADGPIEGTRSEVTNPGGGQRANGFIVVEGGESEIFVIASALVGAGDPEPIANVTINSVTPVGGGPDNCGDPPPVLPPYSPGDYTVNENVTYIDNNDVEVTIPVGIVVAPVSVNNDLSVNVPVTLEFSGGIEVSANLDLSTGDFNFNVENNIDNPTPVVDPTIELDPSGPQGDPLDENAPIGQKIIGVYIKTTNIGPEYTGNAQPSVIGGEEFYVPRLGTVTFQCEILSSSGLGWTQDIDIKYRSQTVYCPVPWGARAVAITPYFGVTMETTLIRGEPERDLMLRAAGVD